MFSISAGHLHIRHLEHYKTEAAQNGETSNKYSFGVLSMIHGCPENIWLSLLAGKKWHWSLAPLPTINLPFQEGKIADKFWVKQRQFLLDPCHEWARNNGRDNVTARRLRKMLYRQLQKIQLCYTSVLDNDDQCNIILKETIIQDLSDLQATKQRKITIFVMLSPNKFIFICCRIFSFLTIPTKLVLFDTKWRK